MKKLWIVGLALLLVGCSTATTYHAKDFHGEGYGDYRLSADRFTVTFRANEHTEPEDVRRFALRRASEVATNYGYRYFIVEQERDLSHTSTVKSKEERVSSFIDLLEGTEDPQKKIIVREREVQKPAMEFMIRCYNEKPKQDVIDAYQFLAYQAS
ncbi:CC0125/CC1285 family lipoprotein [Candidatus Neptunichlamydia sp. REUL1]|uniref:CC0125/CC1285 family lipoprotein n=1 Tax=Candidatus Neptunichlamydia sp. REUL1 TaxID=3064277 RepID=UPI00292D8B8F|nr:hypothetical protein [Candidatus Neptunochlamydia sp. REUL1]